MDVSDRGPDANRAKAIALNRSRTAGAVAVVGVIALLVAASVASHALMAPGDAGLSIGRLRDWAEEGLGWAIAGSLGLMTLHSFVPAPAELIAIGNGIVFGPVLGVVVTWCGAMMGAILAFALARRVGRSALPLLLSEEHCALIRSWQGRPSQLLIVRLVPLISFNLINYAAGVTGVGWWRFLWTTGIGILPITVLSVILGESLFEDAWLGILSAGGLLALLSLGIPYLHRRRGGG